MAMEITNSYSSYAAQVMAEIGAANGTKKKETEKTSGKTGSSRAESTAEYARELAKLVPSVEFKVGSTFCTAKSGKTLTVNPKLLEKMQNDPEQEKETKELIKGVESMTRLMDSIYKGSGWTVVFKHSYIDENGKYRSIALIRNDFMLNMSDKLREERRQNSEKLTEKIREKAAEKKEELQETLEEKRAEKEVENKAEEGEETTDKAEKLLSEKLAASKDGMIYLYDTDLRTIMEAAREDNTDKTDAKKQAEAGANLDLQV